MFSNPSRMSQRNILWPLNAMSRGAVHIPHLGNSWLTVGLAQLYPPSKKIACNGGLVSGTP
jgi:hypothetical protein